MGVLGTSVQLPGDDTHVGFVVHIDNSERVLVEAEANLHALVPGDCNIRIDQKYKVPKYEFRPMKDSQKAVNFMY